jgi:hypothetical protein
MNNKKTFMFEFIKTLLLFSSFFLLSCSGDNNDSAATPTSSNPPPIAASDTLPPLLSLKGSSTVVVQQGDSFVDEGASASDNIDGDLSASVVIEGEVNTSILGEYVLTYQVSDTAGNSAPPVTRTVLVNNDELFLQVAIDTNGLTIVDEPKTIANMQMKLADEVIYDGNIGIEIRGSSSQSFDKKSYGFETWDAEGNDTNFPLAGFPEEEDWIFYGPFSDKSLMRNILIYQLSNQIGMYATKTKFCEITINGTYKGLYVLMEKIKRDKNRVDVSKLKDDDITGGYIIKIDKTTGEDDSIDFSFSSEYDGFGNKDGDQKIKFLYEYPKAEDLNTAQKGYIQDYYRDFEQVLISDGFAELTTGYRNFIDVPSFIDFFLLNELSHNVDGFRISTFMHKDKGEKLKMGPIWDFNIAFGNADYCRGETTDDWAYKFNEYCPADPSRVPFWWARLLEDPSYVEELKSRWAELRNDILSASNIQEKITEHSVRLIYSNSVERNFDTYNVLGTQVWPNFFIGDTYEEETNYLHNWILQRLNWMDKVIAEF